MSPHVGGWSRAAGRARSGVAGGDAGDVRRVERGVAVDRQPARGVPSSAREMRARRSPSASSTSGRPSGSPPDTSNPAGFRNGFVLSTPSSTIADLDPVALRAGERLQLGRADHRRARVGGEVVRGRSDRSSATKPRRASAGSFVTGSETVEAVEHDLVAPADSRRRDRAQELRRRDALRGRELGEIAPRSGACDVEPACRRSRAESPRPWAAASGGSRRPTITRTRPDAWFRGIVSVPVRTRGRLARRRCG